MLSCLPIVNCYMDIAINIDVNVDKGDNTDFNRVLRISVDLDEIEKERKCKCNFLDIYSIHIVC